MKALRKIWRGLTGFGVIFSPRPAGSYTTYLTDTVCYHH